MIWLKRVVVLPLLMLLLLLSGFVYYSKSQVSAAPSGVILIGQIKISTGAQFVSLYNDTASDIDMSTVQLAYYNYYDLTSTKLTSSRFIPLSGKLPSHNYYMVSDGALIVCYKMTINTQSLGFSATAGTLQVIQNGPSNVLDSVAWSKTAVSGNSAIQTLPAASNGFLQRAWLDGVVKSAGDPWISVTPATTDSCDLQAQLAASATPTAPLSNTTPQTVKTVAAAPASSTASPTNLGLVAPEITELLPNPAAPESDDTDEFIELYNPNNDPYSLVGYRLEAGTNYSRGYTFTSGTLLPKSYTAFMITDTGLQLSNSEGRVRMLAQDGTTISETPGYEDAPEGQSWSLVGDSWQWSDTPTPNALNIASADAPANTTSNNSKPTSSAAKSKTTTASKKTTTGKVAGASTATPSVSPNQLNDAAPLHPMVLAGVGAAAVGYAVYEYRKDMANTIFKLRRHLRARRAIRARM